MKKILIALFTLSCTFTIFAQSVEKYKAAHREVAEYRKAVPNPATFAEVQAKVKEIWVKNGLKAASAESCVFTCGVYHYNQRFLKEAYAQAKAKGSVHAVFAVYWYRNKLNITDKEAFEVYVSALPDKRIAIARKQAICDRLLELAPALDAKLVKESLTYLNRALTPKLMSTEKGQYESMVAKIRTMLGTY